MINLDLARVNVIVNIENQQQLEDAFILFDDEPQLVSQSKTLEDLFVELELFTSKNQARKNGFTGLIPFGFNQLGIKRKKLWVWNPKNESTGESK